MSSIYDKFWYNAAVMEKIDKMIAESRPSVVPDAEKKEKIKPIILRSKEAIFQKILQNLNQEYLYTILDLNRFINRNLLKKIFNDFVEYEFFMLPSINQTRSYAINVSNSRQKAFEEISLLEHIFDLCRDIHSSDIPDREKRIFSLYALIHDAGKAKMIQEMFSQLNEYENRLEDHEHYSSEYALSLTSYGHGEILKKISEDLTNSKQTDNFKKRLPVSSLMKRFQEFDRQSRRRTMIEYHKKQEKRESKK